MNRLIWTVFKHGTNANTDRRALLYRINRKALFKGTPRFTDLADEPILISFSNNLFPVILAFPR